MKTCVIMMVLILSVTGNSCDSCYKASLNQNCGDDGVGKDSYTLHMSVHPHLDAFWIFDFDSYYDPQPQQGEVRGYFDANRFTSVKEIFNTAIRVLWNSKELREKVSNSTQEAHRMFFNSEMGFFKHWYTEQDQQTQRKVKEVLKTKYWEILGGGFVEHDEGCAYYDDIIENFELGLNFLKRQFDYFPRVAVSADSFGHSQSTLAILAHLGIEGYFVERSDEHILLKNKTQFIWRAKSANGKVYGALPTHIRWAIHGFEDQFIGSGDLSQKFCETKQSYIENLRQQNQFLKRILKSTHIMRYFGHDFQQFNEYSYSVIQGIMKKFSMEKCNKVVAVYGNPTEYFISLMGEVFGEKVKPVVTRNQDIFPIWDYDSGLYWTGYFTTDAYHKKNYRDMGRLLRGVRKFFLPAYLTQPNILKHKQHYQKLEELAQQVSYLQHHDGISGTSKYKVMDKLEMKNEELYNYMNQEILRDIFDNQFPLGTNAPLFTCHLDSNCVIPRNSPGDIYLKVLNSDGNPQRDPIIVHLPHDEFYIPDCDYELNCFCLETRCPCKLYLYKPLATYTAIRLKKVLGNSVKVNRMQPFPGNQQFSYNQSHFKINYEGGQYAIGYKKIQSKPTGRSYDHLSRYGTQYARNFNIRSGKYALGNDPSTIRDFSGIRQVARLQSERYTFFLIHWKRYKMKTLISIPVVRPNEWKVETITATEAYHLSDLYFQIATPVKNDNRFVTDSNGWLAVQREMFKHQDYQAFFSTDKFDDIDGNSYPCTSFVYIKDGKDKVSVNVERPQGVTSYRKGTIWVNFDRLSEDDGKWVYQEAFRSQYQKYTHIVTVKNTDNNQRKIQRRYDQPLFIQGNLISPNTRVESTQVDFDKRNQWNSLTNINDLKFSLRPFNDSSVILRVQNNNDDSQTTVGLFADKHSPLLTTFYGRTVTFESITEQSLGGNMDYGNFINSKWNWKKVVDLSEENKIFNKIFRENITLSPLEIRTFLLKGLKFDGECIDAQDLRYNKLETIYELNTEKPAPTREPITMKIQEDIIEYMQTGNHCNTEPPVLARQSKKQSYEDVKADGKANNGKEERSYEPKPIDKIVEVKVAESSETKPVKQRQTVVQHEIQPIIHKEPVHIKPEQTNPNPKVSPAATAFDLSFASIQKKINALLPLSIHQKQAYFNQKLSQIRKSKQQ